MSNHSLNLRRSAVAVSFALSLVAIQPFSSPRGLQAQDNLRLVNEAPAGGGRFLELTEQEKAVFQGKIEAEVENGLKVARDRMGVNSEGAIWYLKRLLQMVDRAIDLDVQVRTRLRGRIESALREARRRAVIETERRSRAEQNRAVAIERMRLLEKTTRDENKIRQLMEQFNSLRAEGRYREAEDAAVRIRKLAPNNPVTESIIHNARFASNHAKVHDLREMRQKKFLETLNQVELSSIPFPDDRPIVYPPAEVWRELTRKRLQYRTGGREQVGGSEEKIRRALKQTTKIDFIEVPLRDVVDYFADLHKIPIVIDARALDTVGIGTDTPITQRLQGISLQSALRILLRDLELTYVIRDEVLQITTQEEANANRIIKFYPVGDLIIPIQNTQVNPFAPGGGLGRVFGGGAFGGRGFGGGGFGGGLGGFGGSGVRAVTDEPEDLILIGKKPRNSPSTQARIRQPK